MSKQVDYLAWDITDWDNDADLSEENIRYNMKETFLKNGLALPSSIVCRREQEMILKKQFATINPEVGNIEYVDLGFGSMKLKVLPLERVTITKAIK